MTSPCLIQLSQPQTDAFSSVKSLVTVKIFLNAALACLSHTRELIPWVSPCFQVRYVDQLQFQDTDSEDLYRWFCDLEQDSGNVSQEFRILRRGMNLRADQLLDVIEGGVADTISKGFLQTMQIFVVSGSHEVASVLESYIFSFDYYQDEIASVSLSSQSQEQGSVFTIQDVHKSFATAIRSLLRALKELPRLPRQRSLGFSLSYNDRCPLSFEPAGFTATSNVQHAALDKFWSPLWSKLPIPFTTFNCGGHKISIAASALRSTPDLTSSQLYDLNTSAHLNAMQEPSSCNLNLVSTVTEQDGDQVDDSRLEIAPLDKAGNAISDGNATTTPSVVPSKEYTNIGSRRVTADKARNLVLPEPSTNGLSRLSVIAKKRRRRNVLPRKLAELNVQARAIENAHNGQNALFDTTELQEGFIKRRDRGDQVKCECRSNHKAHEMLFCNLCGTWQHKSCYGYESLRPGGLPEEHFCYNCLLLPEENAINKTMSGIVLMRLALIYLSRQTSAKVEIGECFHSFLFPERGNTAGDFLRTIDRLTREGFITERGDDGVCRIKEADEALLKEAQTFYLDPLAKIAHHYEIIQDGERVATRRTRVKEAVLDYIRGHDSLYQGSGNSAYDQIHLQDNFGNPAVRWGFYSNLKKRQGEELERQSRRQKTSFTKDLINIDRSTPSEKVAPEELVQQLVSDAQWNGRLKNRRSTANTSTEFN